MKLATSAGLSSAAKCCGLIEALLPLSSVPHHHFRLPQRNAAASLKRVRVSIWTSVDLDVNSRKRAKRIKKEIADRLGDEARLVHTVIQSGESLAKQAREGSESASPDEDRRSRLLEEHPELQKEVEKFFASHWRNWLDQKIPALDGLTPRQASKKASHRERLQALLAQFERENERNGSPFRCRAPVEELRVELGLPSE